MVVAERDRLPDPVAGVAKIPGAGSARAMRVEVLRAFGHRRIALVGLVILTVAALTAVAAPLIAPYDPTAFHPTDRFAPPGSAYLLGTDDTGRDLLSRMLYGARISLSVAVIATLIALAVGVSLGLLAGYIGGPVDTVVMRVLDGFLAIPPILLALTLVTALGPGVTKVTIAIGVQGIPLAARLARALALVEKNKDYVLAARSIGGRDVYILRRAILPNCFSPIIVMASLLAANAILQEAALSFLGFGPRPPAASWGSLLQSGYNFMSHSIWFVTFPGIAIFLVVWSLNVVGDALRDGLDPRLRGM